MIVFERLRFPRLLRILCLGIGFTWLLPLSLTPVHGQSTDRLVDLFEVKLKQAGIAWNLADPDSLSEVIKWSKRENSLVHCAYWVEHHLERNPGYLPLRMALADCHFSRADWPRLQSLLSEDDWRFQDHFRLIYLAFAERELGDSDWGETWEAAVATASTDSEKARSLIQFLAQWKKWDRELESLLWQQTEPHNPLDAMALNSLVRLYEMQNRPEGLLRVNAHLLKLEPGNTELISNEISIYTLIGELDQISPVYLSTLRSSMAANPKYALTLALYYLRAGEPNLAEQYFNQIPVDWFGEEQGRMAYLEYLNRAIRKEFQQSNEAYLSLLQSANLLEFERDFLRSILENA